LLLWCFRKKRPCSKIVLGLSVLLGFLIVLLCILSIIYMVRINDTTTTTTESNNNNNDGFPNNNNTSTSVGTTFPPTTDDHPYWSLLDFPDYTKTALLDPESPQSLAYDWLMNDPYLESYNSSNNTIRRLKQRFALATF